MRDYIAAKKRGDRATCNRIIAEAQADFATHTTDGSELAQILQASMYVRFGEDL
ncbi:hypothetical protein [Streptomyces malaysiensis]|uniref:hypothetical protein n=1 Tax=Streptomyces malaysiensis TaxID=92644 RepID=UPI0036C191FF